MVGGPVGQREGMEASFVPTLRAESDRIDLRASGGWRRSVGLPGMDGYAVARQLRTRRQFDRTVLVALTGYGSPEDRQQSQQAGFNAHLVKPVELGALQGVLALRPQ